MAEEAKKEEEKKDNSIGALWVNTPQNNPDGKKYLSGTINDQPVIIFLNKFKKESKHPDYRVFAKEPVHHCAPDEIVE